MTDQHQTDHATWYNELVKLTQDILARSRKVLGLPRPDLFLGRKTQEPFPQGESTYGDPVAIIREVDETANEGKEGRLSWPSKDKSQSH
ncbi:hypothetical protein [Bradyrhizobium sp. UFLA03-84]|uniref:hypothetical protein n=1 Tax=Bradyrhizobium sp. UFLA03-84 TaxID=418599 RepID=UPI001177C998|nr:hypothetical protein [Bradyrhizobium sp. UFLA03-84]